ncbi:hypothetical protein TYRP_003247, partial [Tyrophagus putrescentiae]
THISPLSITTTITTTDKISIITQCVWQTDTHSYYFPGDADNTHSRLLGLLLQSPSQLSVIQHTHISHRKAAIAPSPPPKALCKKCYTTRTTVAAATLLELFSFLSWAPFKLPLGGEIPSLNFYQSSLSLWERPPFPLFTTLRERLRAERLARGSASNSTNSSANNHLPTDLTKSTEEEVLVIAKPPLNTYSSSTANSSSSSSVVEVKKEVEGGDKVVQHHHHYVYHHHVYHGSDKVPAAAEGTPTLPSPPSPSAYVTITDQLNSKPQPSTAVTALASPPQVLIISSVGQGLGTPFVSEHHPHLAASTLPSSPASTTSSLNHPRIPLITTSPPVTPPTTPSSSSSSTSQMLPMRSSTAVQQPMPSRTSTLSSSSTTSSSSSSSSSSSPGQLLEALRNAAALVRTISNGSTFGPINPPPLNEEAVQNWPPMAALSAAAAAAASAASAQASTSTQAASTSGPRMSSVLRTSGPTSSERPGTPIPLNVPSLPRPFATAQTSAMEVDEEVLDVIQGEASDHDDSDDSDGESNRIVVIEGRYSRTTIYPSSQTANRSSLRNRRRQERLARAANSTNPSTNPQPSTSSSVNSSSANIPTPRSNSEVSTPSTSSSSVPNLAPNSAQSSATTAPTTTTTTTIQPFPVQPTLLFPSDLPLVFGDRYILVSQMEASNLYRVIDKETKVEYCCKKGQLSKGQKLSWKELLNCY